MEKYLVYTHASIPTGNIKMNTWYSLEELKVIYDLDYIKTFFSPANFSESEPNKIETVNIKK